MLIKTCCLLCFVCFTAVCFCQIKDNSYGMVITKIERRATGSDTTRFLYIRNIDGNRLAVYTVTGGVVSGAAAYQLMEVANTLWLYSRPLLTDQSSGDSLCVDFRDKTHTVIINKQDRYILFPAFYNRFKAALADKYSIMALLNLLSDSLGDYPISDALPLVNFRPVLAQQI